MKRRKVFYAIISIAIAEGVGFLSGFIAGEQRQVYETLALPYLSPPGWVFPVAWGILYALMGLSAYWVYIAPPEREGRKGALRLYAAQLFVNFLWSIVFFRFNAFGTALIILVVLDVLVPLFMISCLSIKRAAAYLLIPYILWILFATYLNTGIYMLN